MNPDKRSYGYSLDGFLSIRAAINHDKTWGIKNNHKIQVALKSKREAKRAKQRRRNMARLEASES